LNAKHIDHTFDSPTQDLLQHVQLKAVVLALFKPLLIVFLLELILLLF